jgi:hypothetical protein
VFDLSFPELKIGDLWGVMIVMKYANKDMADGFRISDPRIGSALSVQSLGSALFSGMNISSSQLHNSSQHSDVRYATLLSTDLFALFLRAPELKWNHLLSVIADDLSS